LGAIRIGTRISVTRLCSTDPLEWLRRRTKCDGVPQSCSKCSSLKEPTCAACVPTSTRSLPLARKGWKGDEEQAINAHPSPGSPAADPIFPVLIDDRVSALRKDEHVTFSAGAQAEASRLRCSLPHVQRTSNTGTNVIPYGVSVYRTRRGNPGSWCRSMMPHSVMSRR
jgi:hypothetical protein